MADLIKKLTNLRTIRSETKQLTADQLAEIISKLQTVEKEKREIEVIEEAKRREEEYKVNSILDEAESRDVDLELLIQALTERAGGAKTKPRPAKYEYMDDDGEYRTWTGQGRIPAPIQHEIDTTDKTLADFEIKRGKS